MVDQGSPFGGPGIFKADHASILVYEIWTHLDVNNDGYLESCSYVCAGDEQGPKIVIRDVEENNLPYKFSEFEEPRPPIVVGQVLPEPFMMYGKDVPQVGESLQRETNAQRNQEREAVAIALRNHTLVARGSNIDLVSLVNKRIGGVTLGDDISESSIRQMPMNQIPPNIYQSQARTDQDYFELLPSATPGQLGISRSGEETATENQSNLQNANKKVAHLVRNLAHTLFIPTMKMLLRLEQEYESDDFIKLVTGRTLGYNFSADDIPPRSFIQGDFDLTVNFGVNKENQIQRLMMIMERANLVNQTTMGMVQAQVVAPENAKFFDTTKILKRILPLLGEKNTEEFDVASQQPPPEAQAKGIASQTALPGDTGFGATPAGDMTGSVYG